jgi:hypothetical protein
MPSSCSSTFGQDLFKIDDCVLNHQWLGRALVTDFKKVTADLMRLSMNSTISPTFDELKSDVLILPDATFNAAGEPVVHEDKPSWDIAAHIIYNNYPWWANASRLYFKRYPEIERKVSAFLASTNPVTTATYKAGEEKTTSRVFCIPVELWQYFVACVEKQGVPRDVFANVLTSGLFYTLSSESAINTRLAVEKERKKTSTSTEAKHLSINIKLEVTWAAIPLGLPKLHHPMLPGEEKKETKTKESKSKSKSSSSSSSSSEGSASTSGHMSMGSSKRKEAKTPRSDEEEEEDGDDASDNDEEDEDEARYMTPPSRPKKTGASVPRKLKSVDEM